MCATGLKQASVRARLRAEFVPEFRTALEPHLERELRELRRNIDRELTTKDEDGFRRWADGFYHGHRALIAAGVLSLVNSYGERVTAATLDELGSTRTIAIGLFARQFAGGLARRWTLNSVKQLRQLLRDVTEDVDEALLERLGEWEETRTDWTAQVEATQANGAFSKHAYVLDGVQHLRWRANADACPLCVEMDGRTVEITRPFLDEGGELSAGEGEESTTLVTDKLVGHPPLHGMGGKGGVCQCLVEAA